MVSSTQDSRTRLCAVSIALALVLFTALAGTRPAQAQTFNVLYNFTGGSDGGYPYYGSLVRDSAGNLYGVTSSGGSSYCGVVFKVNTSNVESVLYNFTCGSDGGYPYGTPVITPGGNILGTAYYYGTGGYGTIWRLDVSTGALTTLYSFSGSDGEYAFGGLARNKGGVVYGVTEEGGTSGYGVLYSFDPKTSTLKVLHNFAGSSDGSYPFSTPTVSGNLIIGTAPDGGSGGCGTLWQYNNKNGKFGVLHSFNCGTDGGYPYGTPAATAGNKVIYGTADYYGTYYYGTVWAFTRKGSTMSTLYNFTGSSDGGYPYSGILATSSALYGTCDYGGTDYYGVLFSVDPSTGAETVLHSFNYSSDGGDPYAGVIMDPSGNLYGTTPYGGTSYAGTVWQYIP